MRRLPPVAAGAGTLPLAGCTASRLAEALLAARREREPLLAAVLGGDPALALWVVCRAHQRHGLTLHSVAETAAWFSLHLTEQLRWPDDDSGPAIDLGEAAGHAAVAAGALRQAGELATCGAADSVNCRRFLGLLQGATPWLGASAALPPTLAEGLPAGNGEQAKPTLDAPAATSDGNGQACHGSPEFHSGEFQRQWLIETESEVLLPKLVARLARLERLESDFASTLETAKLDSLKELAYGAGHEINNPLANISARAQTLLRDEPHADRRRKLAAIHVQAQRAHEMIADMMLFARPPKLAPTRFEVHLFLQSLVSGLDTAANQAAVEIILPPAAEPVWISADKAQLTVALRAVCSNAIDSMIAGGRVEISCCKVASSPSARTGQGPDVQITISDNGPGIPPECRTHIFDPFYSGREAGRGLGFGLSKCWRIVTEHGGRIDVASASPHGTKVTITLSSQL